MNNPELYDEIKDKSFASVYNTSAQFITEKINWKHEDIIMDYGCGSGQFLNKYLLPLAAANSAKIIYGVDISHKMIEAARCKNESVLAEFIVGNLMNEESWSFKDESVDKFIACLVLCYVRNYRLFLEKIFNLLKPGGQIALVIPFACANAIPNDLMSSKQWFPHFKCTKEPGMRIAEWVYQIKDGITNFPKILQEIGFKEIEYQVEDTKFEFQNVDKLCEFLDVISSASERIPKKLLNKFMEDMITLAKNNLQLPMTNETNEAISVDWKFVNIVAEKPL